ncbi:hypothetical protein JHK87_035865 [Glycine soja]|nr:hypothetical protein JHK87_035865 [Glycine soja]
MAVDFSKAVDDGLKLSKRIYFVKDRAVSPPKPPPPMARSATAFLPSAPMVYAVISDPGIVDNPDISSYQPHVYGRCDPPALIPLQMNAIEMEADCYHETAFVTVSGTWRLHCVMGSRSCDCRIAVPVSHQEVRRHAGSMGFLYDSDVLSWSKVDFSFSYAVSSSHINGGVLLESASVQDFDEREMFYMYLSPGDIQSHKVFKKDIIFIIDISGSMRGKLIEDTKNALLTALSKLNHDDSFNILAFNGETYLFSKAMDLASGDAVERATEWINTNFIAGSGTNISHPLNTAIEMLSNIQSSVPIVFLVTDGTVEDERQICAMVKNRMINGESICPRIYTFGIDLIEPRMLTLFDKASSLILANIKMDTLDDLDDLEVYPPHIPDLSSEGPLILSGRYRGNFPKTLKVKGILADFSNFVVDMKIQNAKDIPVQKISARDQIEHLTAHAWLMENKQLEQKVAKLSLQTGFTSEYTRMMIHETDHLKKVKESSGPKEASKKSNPLFEAPVQGQRMILLPHLGIGFGNLTATAENTPPGFESKLPEVPEIFKAATNCFETLCSYCCCMCCIQCCTRINNQCATALAQLCIGLGCFGCISCCSDICCSGNEG